MKCLGVIIIKVRIKGYLKNNTENDMFSFDAFGIKNKDKISFIHENIKYVINIKNDSIILIRENDEFLNTFYFNDNNSRSNYLLKENGYDIDLKVNLLDKSVSDCDIYIKYVIDDTDCLYEFRIEVSDYYEY